MRSVQHLLWRNAAFWFRDDRLCHRFSLFTLINKYLMSLICFSVVQPWTELWIIWQWNCDDEPRVQRTFSKGMQSALCPPMFFFSHTFPEWSTKAFLHTEFFVMLPVRICPRSPEEEASLGKFLLVSPALYEYPSLFPRRRPRWRVSCSTS